METYVALLRAVNVGGKNKVPMAELRESLTNQGFEGVKTYIQSGNVVFRSTIKSSDEIREIISSGIRNTFGHEVPVVVRNAAELKKLASGNPFLKEKEIDREKLHITLLSDQAQENLAQKIGEDAYLPDRFIHKGSEVYLYCPEGYGETKLNNSFLEKKLGVTATTRNLKTIDELIKMLAED